VGEAAPGYVTEESDKRRRENVEPIPVDTVVLDVDGTLIDSNYHHTMAWWHAFRSHGYDAPAWRIHRSIGMGGDRLVAAVLGEDVEHEAGAAIRKAWESNVDDSLDALRPLPGARMLLDRLDEHGYRLALASPGIPRHTRHSIEVLGADELVDAATTSEDADSSKPDPALLDVALEQASADRAVLVGDSVWDVEAAQRAGLPCLCLLTGGFGRAELEVAGAQAVFEGPTDLLESLGGVLARR
jgi:phosphoglycolate phosphatase-like HAD superfamily hydrolase